MSAVFEFDTTFINSSFLMVKRCLKVISLSCRKEKRMPPFNINETEEEVATCT